MCHGSYLDDSDEPLTTCSKPQSGDQACDSRLLQLEERIRDLESRVPKNYPEVKFLTYKDRKRILVSRNCF